MSTVAGRLLLENGRDFFGQIANAQMPCYGEVVFNTGMSGYVESLTDPSYAGQILVFSYPLIGNYGVPAPTAWESGRIQVQGVVMANLNLAYQHRSAAGELVTLLDQYNIPYMLGVDTRSLTLALRDEGVVAGVFAPTGMSLNTDPELIPHNIVEKVSIDEPVYYGSGDKLVILVDCGMKENILRCLLRLPIRIKRVPHDYDYSNEDFAGVLLSNGPGDPRHCTATINILHKVLQQHKPVFGICLGTQLLALAIGAATYKLKFGHRSHNQPCMYLPTGRCFLTSQNHGYAVDEKTLPADWRVMFRNINDGSVEGIEHQELPFFAVQFHPEAAPGPEDTQWLFDKFYLML